MYRKVPSLQTTRVWDPLRPKTDVEGLNFIVYTQYGKASKPILFVRPTVRKRESRDNWETEKK